MNSIHGNSDVNYLFDPHLLDGTKDNDQSFFTSEEHINKFQLRPLRSTDHELGHLDLLSQLTVTGAITPLMYKDTFDLMKKNAGTYYIIVIEDTENNKIVATGSLVLEKKFIHSCGQRGRIEDIVVDSNYRGKQFGKIVVKRLIALSQILNCYKLSLECINSNVNWYKSMGFVREDGNSNYMQIKFEKY